MPHIAKKLMDECRPGTKIISFAFELPGWNRIDQKGIAIRYDR
jgi:hypothetical protein